MSTTPKRIETTVSPAKETISLSEVISALTFALDMTEGAVPGHALRTCLLGMRIGDGLGLSRDMCANLYYALQLKDLGCSSNASRMTQILGGDDREINAAIKLEDWRKSGMSWRGVKVMWRNTLPGESLSARARRFVRNAHEAAANREAMSKIRCERGAKIARYLDLHERTVEAVRHVDEHWDGLGYPDGLVGVQIPVLARICSLAQNLDVFATEYGPEEAMAMMLGREGTWFDPEMVSVVEQLHAEGMFWKTCQRGVDVEATRRAVLALGRDLDFGDWMALRPERIDRICTAFASVVDAKSPFMYMHSLVVAEIAVRIAETLRLSDERVQLVRRAALLHDLGKLSVPNTILDKRTELTEVEWALVKEHPRKTRAILEKISAFGDLAVIAAQHHERLDGSGYPEGLTGAAVSLEARILMVADMFAAMAEGRSYMSARTPVEIVEIMRGYIPSKLDARCFAALVEVAKGWTSLADGLPLFGNEGDEVDLLAQLAETVS